MILLRPAMRRALILLATAMSFVAAAAQSVPNPIVTGPIPATAAAGDSSHDYPFFSRTDLAARGYIEEEFFFAGTSNTYNVDPAVPKLDTAVVTSAGHPYITRMVVRRPRSPKAFNGVVIMEWQNVAAGFELDAFWAASHEHFMRRGYAWIGVSAQRGGVMGPFGLKVWSPRRYAPLQVANDDLSWDIFSQAAQAVRKPSGVDPMAGLRVKRIFAAGVSLAANRLVLYYNAILPLTAAFDGFFILEGGSQLRTDLDINVFKILSETDVAGNRVAKSQAWIRQANSPHFRRWEIAGASHIGFYAANELNPMQARDGLPKLSASGCERPAFSHIPAHYVLNAAYDLMLRWVQHGVVPPIAPDIAIANLSEQVSVVARDSYGNALGGVRLAQHAVPTASNSGLNYPDLPATNFCRTFGSYAPFSTDTLRALYKDHRAYVSQVTRFTRENLKRGFLVREDAVATIRDAGHSDIP